jgi:hypothetical protein
MQKSDFSKHTPISSVPIKEFMFNFGIWVCGLNLETKISFIIMLLLERCFFLCAATQFLPVSVSEFFFVADDSHPQLLIFLKN